MGTHLIGDVASSFIETVQQRKDAGGVEFIGVPTGFAKVDEYLGGLQPDTVGIVAARASLGKSAWGLDVALNVARQNKRVILYSLEMAADRLTNRLLSRMTHVPGGRILRGQLSDDEMRKVRRASEEFRESPLMISDSTHSSGSLTEHVYKLAERATQVGPELGLVVVDYVALLRDEGINENERLGQISSNLRALARPDQLNVPIVVLAQLNREVEKRENHIPILSDLRSSGNLEQDAEWVILLHRPHYYEMQTGAAPLIREDNAKMIIAKNRDGMTGMTSAVFYPQETRWEQLAPAPLLPNSLGGK